MHDPGAGLGIRQPQLAPVQIDVLPPEREDFSAAADGQHQKPDGSMLRVDLSQMDLEAGEIVFLKYGAAATPVESGTSVVPARFVSLPSIAYRLARVAVGDGVAAVSLNSPEGLDYAGGHALLRGAGGVLLDETGREVIYSREGASHVAGCFGGAPKAARTLAMRAWPFLPSAPSSRLPVALSWPRAVEDDAVDRAKGCLFGQVIGDNLSALVEFQKELEIARLYPDGVTTFRTVGCGIC